MALDDPTLERERRRRQRKKKTTTRMTPEPSRDAGPSVVLAPGARIAERVIEAQPAPPRPSPDTRDRAEETQKRNVRRGARITGGPGTKEVESAIRLASRVRAGKASVLQLQTQLRRAGFNISLDGKWGPQTEAAYRTFSEGLVRAQVESEAVAPAISFDAVSREREQRRLSTQDEEIHASMQEWVRRPENQPWDPLTNPRGEGGGRRQGKFQEDLLRLGAKLTPPMFSLQGNAREDIERAIAEAPDGTWLSRVRDNRRVGKPDLEGLPPDLQRKISLLTGTPVAAGVTPPSKAFTKTLEVLDNLTQDVYQSTIGAPAGLAMFAANPIEAAKTIWNDYKYRYGPAIEGDWDEFLKRQAEHPLFAVLDVAAATTGALRGAQAAGILKREAAIRKLKVGESYVQLYQPGSSLGQRLGGLIDRFSEAHPDLAFVGANTRGARALRQQADLAVDELRTATIPFQRAVKKLNPIERMAYDIMARVGVDDAQVWMQIEANKRWAIANDQEVPRAVRGLNKLQHKQIRRAAASIEAPSDRLLRALALGRELQEGPGLSTEQMKFSLRMLDPETASRRKDLTKQIWGDIPIVNDTPSRLALYRHYNEIYPEHFATLFQHVADAGALNYARKTGGSPEDWYRRYVSEARARIDPEVPEDLPEGIDQLYLEAQRSPEPEELFQAAWADDMPERRRRDRGFPRDLGDLEKVELSPEPERRPVGPPPGRPEDYERARREKVLPRDDEDVLFQEADDADWTIPEDVEAWVRAGQPDPERAPGDMEGFTDEPDIPFEGPEPMRPVSMRPGEPQMPTMRRIPGESDEEFQARSDRAYADYQMRLAAWQATDPDAGTTDLTIPDEWDEDMLAQLEPSPDDYEVRELQVGGRRQWHVRQKGRKGWIIFHQKEGVEGVDYFIREQVRRRQYLLDNHPDAYYQRSARSRGARGVVDFSTGQARIGLDPKTANFSTPIHEAAHVIRRFLPEEDAATLERLFGITDGVWKREHEEAFAKEVEGYFFRGEAPTWQLREIMAQLRKGMEETYSSAPLSGFFTAQSRWRLTNFLDEIFNPLLFHKAGEGAFNIPDVASWRSRGPTSGRRKSLRLPKTRTHRNRGILQAQGRIQRGPKLTLLEFNRTVRLYGAQMSVKELIKYASRPDFENYPETGGVPPNYGLFNPHSVEVPRIFRETPTTDDVFGKFPHERGPEWNALKHEVVSGHFPSDWEKIPEQYREQAMILPTKVIEAFTGDRVTLRLARNPAVDMMVAALDTTNAVMKAALIYGKLSYIPLNLAGNMVFLTLAAGPFAGPALVRAARGIGGLDPEMLAQIDFLVGEGAAAALALEERNALARGINHLAYAQSAVADRLPRRAAWIYHAGRAGFISEGSIRKLLEGSDEVWRDGVTFKEARFQISEQAERDMVQFRGMSPFQQEVISRAVFIFGWLRGATKYGLHSAVERPLRTNIMLQLGQEQWDEMQERFGRLVSYLDGITPVGKVEEMLGVETVPVRSTQAINPVSTAGEALAAIYNTAKGDMKQAGPVISDYLSPGIKTPIELVTGYNIFFGEQYDNRWEAVYGQPMRWPAIKIGRQLISPEVTDADVADQPVERQPNFIIPSEGAARREALEELFLGSARKRNLNFEAAEARGREQRGEPKGYEDYREELIDRFDDAGMGRPPEAVLNELRLQVQLDADPRLDRGTSYKDKLAATAEVAGFEAPTDIPEAAAEKMYLDLRRELFKNLHKWENQADKIIDAQLEEE